MLIDTAAPVPLVILLDVDDTLLDNDRFAADLGAELERRFGAAERDRYWAIYAELRNERGYADYLDALQLFRSGLDNHPGLLAMSGFLTPGGAADAGWTLYTPLSDSANSPGAGTDLWIIGLGIAGLGTILGAVNMITTVVCLRAPGMTLFRMPLLPWLYATVSAIVLVAISPLTACQAMLLIDRYLGGHFFDTQMGGSAILWAHFFWIFGHPEVYVLVLPAFAFANEIIPVFSRKAIFGYPAMVAATRSTPRSTARSAARST